jgi:hypothetical protein
MLQIVCYIFFLKAHAPLRHGCGSHVYGLAAARVMYGLMAHKQCAMFGSFKSVSAMSLAGNSTAPQYHDVVWIL